jgi:hypothetical protein
MKKSKNKHYLVFVYGCTEPSLSKAFSSPEKRDEEARRIFKKEGDEHGYFRLNIDQRGIPSISPFVDEELQKEEANA